MNNGPAYTLLASLIAGIAKSVGENRERDRIQSAFTNWKQKQFSPEPSVDGYQNVPTTFAGADGAPDIQIGMKQPRVTVGGGGVDEGALADLYAQVGNSPYGGQYLQAGQLMFRQHERDDAARQAMEAKRAEQATREESEARKLAEAQLNLHMSRDQWTPEGNQFSDQLLEQVRQGKFTGRVKTSEGREVPAFEPRPQKPAAQDLKNAQWVQDEQGQWQLLGRDPQTGEPVRQGFEGTAGSTRPATYRDKNQPVVRGGTTKEAARIAKETKRLHAARMDYGEAVIALQNSLKHPLPDYKDPKNPMTYKAQMPRGLKNVVTKSKDEILNYIQFYKSQRDVATKELESRGELHADAKTQESTESKTPAKYK